MRNLKRNDTNELIYKAETDYRLTDLENEFMVGGRGAGGRMGRRDS